jgi:hypothetical protein
VATSRRVAVRTTRSVHVLPAGHSTVVVGGTSYYYVNGVYYEAVFVNGRVVYYVVEI